jgi:hypothetical protein
VNFENRYGRLDRLLHRIAFQAGRAQQAMADVERILYRKTLDSISLESPVFITALPRSGTTILLELLWETGHFASHTYQDMPFVLCPLLWNRFSRRFAVQQARHERAHGDGLEVSSESPEAFEEMVWKHFWPDHYRDDHIRPWTASDRNPEFNEFLGAHMRKVIALRRGGRSGPLRYLSKNNLNIARLAAPPGPLRQGLFLVPFREPLQQAASTLQQHRRFLEIQENDEFVQRYMTAIGHHEFGKGLKPVDFGGWLKDAPPPERLEFWVRYWIAAYRYILEHAGPSTVLLSYRRLTDEPDDTLARLARVLGLPAEDLISQVDRLRPPRTHDVDRSEVGASILRDAEELYCELERGAAM